MSVKKPAAEPAVELDRLFVYPWREDHTAEAEALLRRYQERLRLDPRKFAVELRYQGEGRRREGLIVFVNGPERPRRWRLDEATLRHLAFGILCGAVVSGA